MFTDHVQMTLGSPSFVWALVISYGRPKLYTHTHPKIFRATNVIFPSIVSIIFIPDRSFKVWTWTFRVCYFSDDLVSLIIDLCLFESKMHAFFDSRKFKCWFCILGVGLFIGVERWDEEDEVRRMNELFFLQISHAPLISYNGSQ